KETDVVADTHVRVSPVEVLASIKPAFGGVQTGGNASAIVDGAAAVLVGSSNYARRNDKPTLARILAGAVVGVSPDVMGIGPVPAIRAVLERAGRKLDDIDRFEINEAFGAQVMACARALGLDEDKLNVNGGAIAIGHPLGATGVRLALTLARELKRCGGRYGIASACIGAATARALAAAGAKVAVLDMNEKAAVAIAAEIGGLAALCDVASAEEVKAALKTATSEHGPARILVNCAGIGPAKRIVGRDGP